MHLTCQPLSAAISPANVNCECVVDVSTVCTPFPAVWKQDSLNARGASRLWQLPYKSACYAASPGWFHPR